MSDFAKSSLRPMANTVEGHRRDDDPADDRFLDPFGPTHLLSSHVQDCDNQCSDQATKNGTLAAEQTATADHHGGDHKQFVRDRGGRLAGAADKRKLHDSGQAAEQPGQGVDDDLGPLDRHTAEAGRVFARADGKDVPPERKGFFEKLKEYFTAERPLSEWRFRAEWPPP